MLILRQRGKAFAGRGKDDRRVELFVGGVQIEQQLQNFVDDFAAPRIGAVNLVDDDDGL